MMKAELLRRLESVADDAEIVAVVPGQYSEAFGYRDPVYQPVSSIVFRYGQRIGDTGGFLMRGCALTEDRTEKVVVLL
jgi:hypothetical protein